MMSHTKWQWVGHLFTYVKTCERDRVKDIEQQSRVYYTVRYNAFFLMDPDGPVIMEWQCISKHCKLHNVFEIQLVYMNLDTKHGKPWVWT